MRALLLGFLLLTAGCSTVETSAALKPVSRLASQDRIQLRVRTGNEQMDRLLYEMAYQQFSDSLPIRENEPYTGFLELTFSSTTQNGFMGSQSSNGVAVSSANGWYSGNATGSSAITNLSSATFSSGAELQWQNSTMLAVLKRADGERLWSADYNYKGGWELSGWVVNTPEEAARLVTKRLKSQYVSDLAKNPIGDQK